MQTTLRLAQLADPRTAEADGILRTCVHCGFCTATCPTYVLLGDELDSPRGRIYLIKDMLEHERPATAEVVKHIDRCLSCLACMTTCPSGVHYMHLVDHARAHIEKTYTRPLLDRLLRAVLARVLPYNGRFRRALGAARLAKPFAGAFAALGLEPVAAMLRLAPARLPAALRRRGPPPVPRGRAAARPRGAADGLRRAGDRTRDQRGRHPPAHPPRHRGGDGGGPGCCGRSPTIWAASTRRLAAARRQIDAWTAEIEGEGLDAIVVTASGCGTTIKDYGFMLRNDRAYADKAARVSRLAMDISEYLAGSNSRRARPAPAYGRLSLRLLAAARPENHARRKNCFARSASW